MRRTITATLIGAIALTAIVPTAASAAETDRATDIEVIRLDCRVRSTDTEQAIRCEWSPPQSAAAAAVKLFRLDPAVDDHRRLIYRSADLDITSFTDTRVRQGHRYAYGVVVVNEHGRIVGRSRAEWVRVPLIDTVEPLRLRCELGPQRAAIGCEWSQPHSPDAFVVTLWRSVDGGERERVERFRPSGPNAYRDPVPPRATHVTYAVIATSESGEIVARSRPATVRIPDVDAEPTVPIAVEPVAP